MEKIRISFPEGFLWGSASAAHQVEGNNNKNQWWDFENRPGKIITGEKSGIACDHYNRYEEDFNLLKEMKHNAHRISFEWSRFFPDNPNDLNTEAVEHYHKVLDKLIELKIEPFVTTLHFAIPLWFAKKGGFEEKENIKYYVKFVEFLVKEYKSKIKFWNTINEPAVYATEGYFSGVFPPGKNSMLDTFTVIKNQILAHAKAYHAIKAEDPDCKVGIVKQIVYLVAKNINNPFDRMAAGIADHFFNGIILKALRTGEIAFPAGIFEKYDYVKDTNDFFGLNYYFRKYITLSKLDGDFVLSDDEKVTQMGNAIFPEGLYLSLMRLKRELNLPIYITENGICTDDDEWRTEYIKVHLKEVHRAINEGADVRGYFYWSNTDNFEWNKGYNPKFGLIDIDRENNLKRKIKNSAKVYTDIITNNGFED